MSCGCQTSNSNCVREPFNANFVRPLTYVRGVDANGCVSYAPIGNFSINVQNTNTLDLTLTGTTLSGAVRVSTNAGNQIQALANGLYVPPSFITNIQDTSTVDLNVVGGTLLANVNVSTNPGNAIQILPNGLYVPTTTFNLNVADTNTVDLTLTGGTLSAQVIVSPNAGNALQALANGLFVPSTASLSVQDTQSVDLTLTGGVLSANVIISPNPNNQLQLLANGLYVPPVSLNLNAADTNTVDLNLAGTTLTANVIISPNAGNALQSLANGLYVPQGNYSLSNCAGTPLPIGSQVLTCPSAPSALNISDTLLSFVSPGTGQRTLSAKQCPEPQNDDYIIIADSAGSVRYTAMREAVFYNLLAGSPIVFPNLPLVTLQPPNTTTGIIDSASFTNPLNCFSVYPKGVINGILRHSFNANGVSSAIARISFLRDLISRIENINTPGITNTPLTGHAWRNQVVFANLFSAERIIDLGAGISPGVTVTYNRELSALGATDFYYITAQGWGASFSIVKV